jgi:hypothetical protein
MSKQSKDSSNDLLRDAIVVVTGARGVGKSLLALTYYPPQQESLSRVFVHDSERSDNRAVQEVEDAGLSFGHYGDLSTRFKDLPSTGDLLSRIDEGKMPWLTKGEKGALRSYYEYIVTDLNQNLTRDKFDVYVHDTIEKMEGGMAAWVEDNIKLFGYVSAREARKNGRIWSDAIYGLYEHLISAIFDRGVKVIIFASHLKNPWHDRKPVPGKVAPGGKPLLYKLSSLMLWLVNEESNADGAPAALVLKERMGKMSIVDGEWQIRRMIPRRIPHCTWADIKRYLREGCDLANPAPGETMERSEKQMISELLTNEQMRLMILSAEDRQSERQESEMGGSQSPSVAPFVMPAPEYNRARERAASLQASNQPITEDTLLKAFAPPARGKPAVKEAVAKVLAELGV